GTFWAFIFCDASSVVVEFDEDNNVQRYIETVTVAVTSSVDLEPKDLRIEPASPVTNGTAITALFDVCNNGSTGSSPTVMRILMSQDSQPDPNDRIAFESVLPGLAPGVCQAFEATID